MGVTITTSGVVVAFGVLAICVCRASIETSVVALAVLESPPHATVASAISAASAKKVREYFCRFFRIFGVVSMRSRGDFLLKLRVINLAVM